MPGYLNAIDADIREKEREIVDIEDYNYRQQIGRKFVFYKTCRYKKKVHRGNFDVSGVQCNYKYYLYLIKVLV